MGKKLKDFVKTGYVIEVESWENDGDEYATNYVYTADIKVLKSLEKLAWMCTSGSNNGGKTIGNSSGLSESQLKMINKFMKKNKSLTDGKKVSKSKRLEVFNNYASQLLGYSEFYSYRVTDSVNLYKINSKGKIKDLSLL